MPKAYAGLEDCSRIITLQLIINRIFDRKSQKPCQARPQHFSISLHIVMGMCRCGGEWTKALQRESINSVVLLLSWLCQPAAAPSLGLVSPPVQGTSPWLPPLQGHPACSKLPYMRTVP